MSGKSDFPKIYHNSQAFVNAKLVRSLLDESFYSIDNISKLDLQQSILEDILMFTMWEITFKHKLNYNLAEMVRFVKLTNYSRVMNEFNSNEVQSLITITDGQIRITDRYEIRQAVMDLTGVFYHGYKVPPNENIVFIDYGKIDEMGGIEQVISDLIDDNIATHPPHPTMQ